MPDRVDRPSLLAQVCAALEAIPIPHALVGARALSIHGVTRSTLDLDLLAVDPACLDPRIWSGIAATGVPVKIRKGELNDPLAGVVRLESPGELPLDLVIGKHTGQKKTMERAGRALFAGVEAPILGAVDLILLKLYAGGPQDAWHVRTFSNSWPAPSGSPWSVRWSRSSPIFLGLARISGDGSPASEPERRGAPVYASTISWDNTPRHPARAAPARLQSLKS